MAEWWRFDRSWTDEWKRTWTEIVSMSSAAAASIGLPQPGTLPGDPFAALVDAARAWLTGKKRTFRFSGHDLTLTLSDISVDGADLARVVGQYGQVRISARDVQWHVYQMERIEVRASNVYVRPGKRLTLVTAPVHCEAFVSASFASSWLATVSPRLELALVAACRWSAWRACRGCGWKWKRAPRAGPSACGRVPCTCSTGGCHCGPRRFTWLCRTCPPGSC